MRKVFFLLVFLNGIANAQIVNIPDANFKAKLIQLGFDTDADGNIQLTEAQVPTVVLDVSNSNISDLTGIQSFSNLWSLNCSNNQLSTLTINGLTILSEILTSNNQLTSFNFTNLPNLSRVECNNNQLTSINFSGNSSNFIYFDCSNNLISSINSDYMVDILEFLGNTNQITHLDLSNIRFTSGLIDVYNNPLITVNSKNGYVDTNLINVLYVIPSVEFICADENEIVNFNQVLTTSGNTSVLVNSYCSFTPGGNYNIITGTTTFDADNSGCDSTDAPQPNIKVNINDGTNQGATFTNNTGNFNFYTPAGSFDLTPSIENPTWFTFSPQTATIPFADNNNNTTTQNFCITANGIHPDVEIAIAPITPARPGFDAVYQIVYKNKGNQTLSGNLTFTYDDSVLDFISATVVPDTQSTGLLNWNYTNLLPFENRSIYITLNVNAPTETPAVNIGDILNFEATITPVIGDEIPDDNLFTYNQTVVGSYDPNDIECLEGDIVPPTEIGDYLHYIINFENTGTAPAENVVVKTTIDATKFDVNTLQIMNTSHNAYIKQTGNVIEFIFENLNLDSGGHGNVLLKVKTNNTLVQGDMVFKRADIFFDYNFPIDTGFANTTFQALSNPSFDTDNSISVSPNPSASIVNINGKFNIKSVQLYDVQGRLLQTQLTAALQTTINISDKSNGIYFLKITSDKGIKVEKIVKE